jgi:hypothetical protein
MAIQKSKWYVSVLSFNTYLLTKLVVSYNLKILLHDACKILDKPILNQGKALDAVIIFKCSGEV